MNAHFAHFCAASLAALCLSQAASATVLYDPALGSRPSAPQWVTFGLGPYTDGVAGGVYHFESMTVDATMAGSGHLAPLLLDTAAGFNLSFDLRLVDEAHVSPNRAGFSFLVTGEDPAHSIEIAFWKDRVWAYAYDAAAAEPFVHGAEALFDTVSASHVYSLQVQNQQFSLSSGSTTLLSGALVDYTAQGTPYTSKSFIFFGDDTSRARSSIEIGVINLSPVPEPAGWALMGLGVAALLGARGRRR